MELRCVVAHVHQVGRVASLVVHHAVVRVGLEILGCVTRLRLGGGLDHVASCYPLAIPGFHLNIIRVLNEHTDCGKNNQPSREPWLQDSHSGRCSRVREDP